MRKLAALLILAVLILAHLPNSSPAQHAIAQDAPHPQKIMTIGRGYPQEIAWPPSGDYVMVSTVMGAWIYSPELEDLAHIPEAKMARLSPDGRYIAGVDDEQRVRLWDGVTFEAIETENLSSLYRRVYTLAWDRAGRYLAISGDAPSAPYKDGVSVWEIADEPRRHHVSDVSADALYWSPTAHRLAMHNTQTNEVFIMSRDESGEFPGAVAAEYATPLRKEAPIIMWQNDHNLLMVEPGEFSTATRWNVDADAHVDEFQYQGSEPSYSPRGDRIAVLHGSNVSVREVSTLMATFGADTGYRQALSAVWEADGDRIAVGSFGLLLDASAGVSIVDATNGEIIHQFGGLLQNVPFLAWGPDSQHIMAADSRGQLFIFDLESDTTQAYSDAHTLVGDTLVWHSQSNRFALADTLGMVSLWDTEAREMQSQFGEEGLATGTMKWQPGGTLIALTDDPKFGGTSEKFSLWDTATSTRLDSYFEGIADLTISYFDWHPDGSQFAALDGKNLHFWSADGGSLIETGVVQQYSFHPEELVWSPSGRYLVAPVDGISGLGSEVYDREEDRFNSTLIEVLYGKLVWSAEDELVLLKWGIRGAGGPPFSPTMGVRQYNPPIFRNPPPVSADATFRLLGLLESSDDGFLSPQGSYAAGVDANYNGMIWDATNGNPLAMPAQAAQFAWPQNESHLAIQRTDGSLWLAHPDGRLITQLKLPASIQSPGGELHWSPDGRYLALRYEGSLHVWEID